MTVGIILHGSLYGYRTGKDGNEIVREGREEEGEEGRER